MVTTTSPQKPVGLGRLAAKFAFWAALVVESVGIVSTTLRMQFPNRHAHTELSHYVSVFAAVLSVSLILAYVFFNKTSKNEPPLDPKASRIVDGVGAALVLPMAAYALWPELFQSLLQQH